MALAHCGPLVRSAGPIAGLATGLGAPRRTRLVVRAGPDNKEEPNVDWDSAWRKYKSTSSSNSGTGAGPRPRTTTKAPKFGRGSSGEWNSGPTANDIRRQERTLLDVWTKESFSQLAIAGVVLLLLFLVVAAGPPPTDSRCTLPWC